MSVAAIWAELRDQFLAEHKDQLRSEICELYALNPKTFNDNYVVIIEFSKENGVMYLMPHSQYDAYNNYHPIKDLPRIGIMRIDYSEPCLVYELDEFDNSLL